MGDCGRMSTVDLPVLPLGLGQLVNVIEVDPETERWAKVALQRMLDLPAKQPARD